jgi:hypothetical protein
MTNINRVIGMLHLQKSFLELYIIEVIVLKALTLMKEEWLDIILMILSRMVEKS